MKFYSVSETQIPSAQKAWVVFSGQTDMAWLRLLKKDFRHCYVVLFDGAHWISVEPLANTMEVTVHDVPPEFDLPLWLSDQGLTVVPAQISKEMKQAPWMVFTCVEAVKRILGIHKRFIFTPWQLYRHLTKTLDHKGELSWVV